MLGAHQRRERPGRCGPRVPPHLTCPRSPRPFTFGTGIAIRAERHRRQLLHSLRLADPTGAASGLSAWQAINFLTAGRLLTSRSG
jgi:hypothetical protein